MLSSRCNRVCVCARVGAQCVCNAGYSGARCEVAEELCARTLCANGGTCRPLRLAAACLCAPGYTGKLCEQCIDETCDFEVKTAGDDDALEGLCNGFCFNGGSCRPAAGRAVCACAAQWSGERCQRPACEDAACAPQPPHAPLSPQAPSATPPHGFERVTTNREECNATKSTLTVCGSSFPGRLSRCASLKGNRSSLPHRSISDSPERIRAGTSLGARYVMSARTSGRATAKAVGRALPSDPPVPSIALPSREDLSLVFAT
ncbi:unnamed protein product, partial [Iphiclides podalirius]